MTVIDSLKSAGPTILPSMLLCDFSNLADELAKLEDAGVTALHLDIMDGVFVPNFTYGMTIVEAIRKVTDLPIDAHLMMVNPEKYIQAFHDSGADIITVHVEAVEEPSAVLDQIRGTGSAAGIAVNASSPVSEIADCLPHADMALVMSVQAGFGGQSFDRTALDKLKEIRQMKGGRDILLQIDGGINSSTIRDAVDAGAELLVAGSAVFRQPDYRVAIESMMSQLDFAS